jgi:hypothetical protein
MSMGVGVPQSMGMTWEFLRKSSFGRLPPAHAHRTEHMILGYRARSEHQDHTKPNKHTMIGCMWLCLVLRIGVKFFFRPLSTSHIYDVHCSVLCH